MNVVILLTVGVVTLGLYTLAKLRWPIRTMGVVCHHSDIANDFHPCPAYIWVDTPTRQLNGRFRLPAGWEYAEDVPTRDGHPAIVCPVHAPHHLT